MPSKPHTEYFFYRLGYTSWAFSFLRGLSAVIGRRLSKVVGETTGKFYAATHSDIARVVTKNLEILEGHPVTKAEAGNVVKNFSVMLADYLWLASRSQDDALELAEIEEGTLHIAHTPKCGVILATGHYGFFELGAVVLRKAGFPVSVITHAEPTSALTKWRADYRRRWGVETIELGNDAFSSLRVVEAIQQGRVAAMLVDRPLGGRALNIHLPGGVVAFSASPAILSWTTGCAIVPVTVRRLPSGKYAIHTGAPVFADRSRLRDEAILACTKQIAEALSSDFRRDPLQWYHFIPLTKYEDS